MKSSQKKLKAEIANLQREVERLRRVHAEYLRQHSDWPEKVARLLRKIKALSRGL